MGVGAAVVLLHHGGGEVTASRGYGSPCLEVEMSFHVTSHLAKLPFLLEIQFCNSIAV
jgi:hypothetical protein